MPAMSTSVVLVVVVAAVAEASRIVAPATAGKPRSRTTRHATQAPARGRSAAVEEVFAFMPPGQSKGDAKDLDLKTAYRMMS